MTDKLREEIRQLFLNALYCTSSEESIEEIIKIIERERKAGVDEFIEALREMMSGEKELGELKMWNYRSKIGPVINLFIKKIEHERRAAHAEATIRRAGSCDKCGRVAEDKDYTYFPDLTPGNEGWGDVLCDRCVTAGLYKPTWEQSK